MGFNSGCKGLITYLKKKSVTVTRSCFPCI